MFFLWLIVAGLLQITVFHGLEFFIIFAVISGFRRGPIAGLFIGALIGAFAGVMSISPFILSTSLYAMVGFISGFMRSHLYYKENIFIQMALSFSGIFLFYLVYFVLTGTFQVSAFSTIFISGLISPILFRMVKI